MPEKGIGGSADSDDGGGDGVYSGEDGIGYQGIPA